MNDRGLKRLILSVSAVSCFLLHTMLLILFDMPVLAVLLVSLFFIANMLGMHFFFCISVGGKGAVFTALEYLLCAGAVPTVFFTAMTFTNAFGMREVYIPTLLTVVSGTLLVLCVDIMLLKDSDDDDE